MDHSTRALGDNKHSSDLLFSIPLEIAAEIQTVISQVVVTLVLPQYPTTRKRSPTLMDLLVSTLDPRYRAFHR